MIPPGFLQAIIDDPADDTPRLILADYLEDSDPARSEFIRCQVRIAAMDEAGEGVIDPHEGHTCVDDPCEVCRLVDEYGRLQSRARELFDRFGLSDERASLFGVPSWCYTSETLDGVVRPPWKAIAAVRRGFVEEIKLAWDSWREHHAQLALATPITSVAFMTWPELESTRLNLRTGPQSLVNLKGFECMVASDNHDEAVRELLRIRWPKIRTWTLPVVQ